MGTIDSMHKNSAIEIKSMLEDCVIDPDSKILVYVQGDANDADYVGELYELSFDQYTVDYLRVILHIFTHYFNPHHWETENPFDQYGIGDHDDYDYDYDDEDEDCDAEYDDENEDYDAECDEGESPYAEIYDPEATSAAREKMMLELIYDFMEEYLPSNPGWGEKCHSVVELRAFIICSEYSGELLCGDVTDEDIVSMWKANKAR